MGNSTCTGLTSASRTLGEEISRQGYRESCQCKWLWLRNSAEREETKEYGRQQQTVTQVGQVVVAHACNPNSWEAEERKL